MGARGLAKYVDGPVDRAEGDTVLAHPAQRGLRVCRDLPPAGAVALEVATLFADEAVEGREDDEAALGELRDAGLESKERRDAALPGAAVKGQQGPQAPLGDIALVDAHLEFAAVGAAANAVDGRIVDLLHKRLVVTRDWQDAQIERRRRHRRPGAARHGGERVAGLVGVGNPARRVAELGLGARAELRLAVGEGVCRAERDLGCAQRVREVAAAGRGR